MNLEAINKWLDEEYGCSYTKLEELHDFYFEKYCDLKQENKILKENAENNDKVVDKVNWENMLLKKENKQLNGAIQTYDILLKSNIEENKQLKENYGRIYNENCKLREEHNITDISLLDENYKLKDNWNKLKEFIVKEYYMYLPLEASTKSITILIDKMHEIEKGDSNE